MMKKHLVYFRADANPDIGSGHIMRCLSIAAALQLQGYTCRFVTADKKADGLLQTNHMDYDCLNSDWNHLETELPLFEQLLKQQAPDFLVVDHYYVTEKYLASLQKCARVVYIDDLQAFRYPCEMLINYNAYALDWENSYRQQYTSPSPTLLLGPQYVPLRKEFQSIPHKSIKKDVDNVLISTGGADPENMAGRLLLLIANNPNWNQVTFHFVVGALNPNRAALERISSSMVNVQLHFCVNRMSELMQHCDLAIAAAGSTLYELCACGVPTITYVLADNQMAGAAAFAKRGLMLNAGDCRRDSHFEKKITALLQGLLCSFDKRSEMSAFMQRMVDGSGAERIANHLMIL